jgi:alcohol dehydrogenase (cytochrome c)
VNRGLAILGNTLFMVTIDARLVAVDARDGKPLWRTAVAEPTDGYAMTMAPLVVKDKVIVGVAGGEYGIRGFIAAFDAVTGKEVWRFYTSRVPANPATRHGAAMIGRPAERRSGSRGRTTRSSISPIGARGIQGLTGIPPNDRATICRRRRSWRSTPTQAN